jgi:hypothetical protein
MWSEVPLGDELRAEFGRPRRVQRLRSSPRSRVWLIEKTGAPVVIKELVEGPNAVDRFSRELAALRLAARTKPPLAPRLLAADSDRRVLVLELLVQAENAYRSEWRLLTGTDVHGELADVYAGWLIRGDALVARAHRGKTDYLARIPERDWTWGTATARERLLHRLAVVAQSSIDRPELSALGRCCKLLRDRMLARWPALQPLPLRRPPSRGSFIVSESGSQV